MADTKKKISFSPPGNTPYTGDAPPWFDLAGLQWYDELTANIPAIRKEVISFLEKNNVDMKTYFNANLIKKGVWSGKGFVAWGLPDKQMIAQGKDVYKYFKDIPGFVSLSISVLQPNTHISGHYGETDAIYRMHVPIVIPSQGPECILRVGGIDKHWQEDKINAFCDAHFHEAWNNTDQVRIVLIVDVVRGEYLKMKRTICAKAVAILARQKIFIQMKIENKMPKSMAPAIITFSTYMLILPARFMLWYKNR